MFKEERDELQFDWRMIGNIGEARFYSALAILKILI